MNGMNCDCGHSSGVLWRFDTSNRLDRLDELMEWRPKTGTYLDMRHENEEFTFSGVTILPTVYSSA